MEYFLGQRILWISGFDEAKTKMYTNENIPNLLGTVKIGKLMFCTYEKISPDKCFTEKKWILFDGLSFIFFKKRNTNKTKRTKWPQPFSIDVNLHFKIVHTTAKDANANIHNAQRQHPKRYKVSADAPT